LLSIASSLAGNVDRLADLRTNMRQRMAASPLMDARRFTRNIEAAFARMWSGQC
jgi:protein O-GlcNAc transferase